MRALLVLFAWHIAFWCGAQVSPFNGLEVIPADSTGHYRILIGGHFHGASTNRSGYPAATLLANLDTINALGANLFLSTGDLFMDAEKDRARYEHAFFSKLKVPLFNAPGNHDGDEGFALSKSIIHLPMEPNPILWVDLSQDPTNVGHPDAFLAEHRIILIDSERNEGSLDSTALRPLEGARQQSVLAAKANQKFNVFIISHRPIWSEGDAQYSDLFKDNTRSLTGTNFHKDVYPILEKIAEHSHVYWISGSLGGGAPSSIFFQNHAPNITYIQCAIRDEPRDALLIADVYPDTVKWSALSLTGQELLAPEAYDAAWWREHIGKEAGFNWRLLPYLIKTTVISAEFWWGALAALLLVWSVRRLVRRG